MHTINHTATVGQDVHIPCGINSMKNVTRLVWKTGQSASDSEELAYSFESNVVCDKSQKDCDLKGNGDLVIHNVKVEDSDDKYFCFLDDEQYYAEHTLNILPTGLFLRFTITSLIFCRHGHFQTFLTNYL